MGSAPSKPAVAPAPALAYVNDEKLAAVQSRLSALTLAPADGPLAPDGALTLDHVDKWEAVASADPKVRLARTVLAQANLRDVLVARSAKIADPLVFNTELDFATSPITNQKSSGRCWLFAATNTLRFNIMKKLNLKEFQLSQVRRAPLLSLYGPLTRVASRTISSSGTS